MRTDPLSSNVAGRCRAAEHTKARSALPFAARWPGTIAVTLACGLLLFLGSGCAILGGSGGVDDEGPAGRPDPRAAQEPREPVREHPLSPEVERMLEKLSRVAALRETAPEEGPPPPPPEDTIDIWDRLVLDLDVYLNQPAHRIPLLELIETRGALEQELEADRRTWRLSAALESRIGSRLAYLEHRIEQEQTAEMAAVQARKEAVRLVWPMESVEVTSPFGWRRHPVDGVRRFHLGIDLRAIVGQAIVAAESGVVTWAGWRGGHGYHVEIEHGGGWMTRYSHLSNVMVRAGETVEKEDVLGFAGDSGRVTGPHLHFEVWRNGRAKDPMAAITRR